MLTGEPDEEPVMKTEDSSDEKMDEKIEESKVLEDVICKGKVDETEPSLSQDTALPEEVTESQAAKLTKGDQDKEPIALDQIELVEDYFGEAAATI